MKPMTAALAAALLAGCASAPSTKPTSAAAADLGFTADPYPSTYRRVMSPPVLLQGATVLTGTGSRLDNADVLLRDGRIVAVGAAVDAPADAQRIDARGKWVTPGIIDIHSHLGVYSSPAANAHSDGNEATSPNTASVWAEHSVWPQDPGFHAALAGGITSLQVLPGSANLIGGRGVTLKNVSAVSYQGMKFPGAPWGLKMACGENPKRVYGSKGGPSTRMGNIAGFRAAFADAADYMSKRKTAAAKAGSDKQDSDKDSGGKRDLKLDTLAGAINGEIMVHIHCYRADEMAIMLDLAKEFGFKVAAFHHGAEAYKLADRLAAEGVCGALWADWWGFKMEALDGIQENIALVDRPAGSCAIVHSDSAEGIQRLNQEAAKVMASARRMGMDIPPERAITWLTSNAARSLGVENVTGSLQVGRMADVVVWNRDPFSVYALAEQVYIDGARVY
ncbi:MAG: amidohydrolase family protein, partial [Lysobacter sp.]|nr:amidohydrolase family protein [Lysobacter sp.]